MRKKLNTKNTQNSSLDYAFGSYWLWESVWKSFSRFEIFIVNLLVINHMEYNVVKIHLMRAFMDFIHLKKLFISLYLQVSNRSYF